MPVFDWLRTDLFHPMENGATALFYSQEEMQTLTPEMLLRKVMDNKGQYSMAGWEPERLGTAAGDAFCRLCPCDRRGLMEKLRLFFKMRCPRSKKKRG